MKYSSTSRLVNAIVFPILLIAFGALGVYFSFFVSPTYLSSLGQAQYFTNNYAYNFSVNFGMLGIAVAALACYGTFLAIKGLNDKSDAAVEKTFFVYVAIAYVFAAWFALNALVFYRLIGGAQYVFWIVIFVILLIGALIAGNVPLMKILDGRETNDILVILVEAAAALALGYICNTIPTTIVGIADSASGNGNYALYTNQLLVYSILGVVALCAACFAAALIKKGSKLGEILAGATLLPFGGIFVATSIFEIVNKYVAKESKFSLQGLRGVAGGMDYIIMTMAVGAVLVIGGIIFLASSALPEKKKAVK